MAIDVLRATTTMTAAIAAGATQVIARQEISESFDPAAALPPGSALLGGERRGVRIEGFDLGNSPAEYAPAIVAGKNVILTTTNGTRAMAACRSVRRAFIAAFTNATATANAMASEKEMDVVCAGTDGSVTTEDVLLAGWLALDWQRMTGATSDAFDDGATLAMSAARGIKSALDVPRALVDYLRASRGGRNLIELGFDDDIAYAARVDLHPRALEFDPRTLTIVG